MTDTPYKKVVTLQGDTGAQGPQGLKLKEALKVLKAIQAETVAPSISSTNDTITEIKEKKIWQTKLIKW